MTELVLKDRVTLPVAGQDQEFFMSYGLVNSLAMIVGSQADFAQMYTNPLIQEAMLEEILKRRRPSGEQAEPFSLNDIELSQQEALDIVKWAAEHVVNFFLINWEIAKDKGTEYANLMERLLGSTSSSNGTEDSQLTTAPVGSLDVSPATST